MKAHRIWLLVPAIVLTLTSVGIGAQASKKDLTDSLAGAVWLSDWASAMDAIEQGADPNAKVQDGSPVLTECMRESPATAKALIRHGADPNTLGSWGWPALCTAACVDLELTKMLLDRGANLQVRTKDGDSPLTAAAMSDRPEIVAYLLKRGLPLEGRSDIGEGSLLMKGVTPLMVAAKHAALGSMKTLLDAGADPTSVSGHGATPLAYAMSGFADYQAEAAKIVAAMALLIDRGAPVDQPTSCHYFYSSFNPIPGYTNQPGPGCGFTPLMIASAFHWYPAVTFLLQRKADPNLRSNTGIPLLFWAADSDADGPLEGLLAAGTDPNVTGNFPGRLQEKGVTPLMIAAAAGAPLAVKCLLRHNADPNRVSDEGIPTIAFPWRRWSRQNLAASTQVAQLLLDGGADLTGRPAGLDPGHPWVTPPLAALQGGGCEGSLWLVEHGADPRQAGSDGTSLAALFCRQFEAIKDSREMPDCYQRLLQFCK